jgi:hypothetical protein
MASVQMWSGTTAYWRTDPSASSHNQGLPEACKSITVGCIAKPADLRFLFVSAATALKGSASNLGASNLAALGDEIEQAAKAGFLADAVPVLDKAAAEFARVRDTLEKMKSEAKDFTAAFDWVMF